MQHVFISVLIRHNNSNDVFNVDEHGILYLKQKLRLLIFVFILALNDQVSLFPHMLIIAFVPNI